MHVGLGVLLLVVGAILAFAIHASVAGVDLAVVGWILMAGGLLAVVLSLSLARHPIRTARRVTYTNGTEISSTVAEVREDLEM